MNVKQNENKYANDDDADPMSNDIEYEVLETHNLNLYYTMCRYVMYESLVAQIQT